MATSRQARVDGLERWPLVGRDDELALARATLAGGDSIVLTGPPGVGKTRLARELLGARETPETLVAWVAATDAASNIPLGAVAHLLPAEAIDLAPASMLRRVLDELGARRDGRSLLLGVDDAHLLDRASATVIHALVSADVATAVVTFRAGETVPDAITAMWKDGTAPLIALQALARSEVEQVLAAALDAPIDGATLEFLWTESAGNALFLRELVQHGIETGALRRSDGMWRWPARLDPGERLTQLVARRIGDLAAEERAALELVAVGEPLTNDAVRALGLVAPVEQLERRALLSRHDAAARSVRLVHPLFSEVVRAGVPGVRLDEIKLQLADALEATSDGADADRFRVALWRAQAGDSTRPDELRWAAHRAWVLWDPAGAEQLARAALRSGPDLEAGVLLGEALSDQQRSAEALAAWAAVEHLDGPDLVHVKRASGQAGVLLHQLDQPEAARDVLTRLLARLVDPAAREMVADSLAAFGLTDASQLRLSERDELTPVAALALANDLTTSGQADRAIACADRVLSSSDEWIGVFPTTHLLLKATRVWARALRGDLHEADAEASAEYQSAVELRADQPRVSWCLVRGLIAMLRGAPARATAALREGVLVQEQAHADRGFVRPSYAYMAMAAALAGDVDAAERHRRSADAANRSLDRVFGVDVARAGAWIHAASGELTAARDVARAAAELAQQAGLLALEAFARHDVARFGAPADVVDRLDELAAAVDGIAAPAMAAHARALARDDADALVAASQTFATCGFDLFAAESRAAAAPAFRRAGRKASALAAHRAAADLATACDGARVAALAGGDEPDDLTAREREVAVMAASGLASRVIAERLGITARTVDNLLGRVYVKLGISGRQGLAEVFSDHGPAARP